MLTKQEIFDKVFIHLMTQNDKSWTNDVKWMCGYRGTEGKMCAVGCLIKDEFYSESIEGCEVCVDRVMDALNLSGIDTTDDEILEMLQALQQVHDSAPVKTWATEICRVALTSNVGISADCVKYIVEPDLTFSND
jgi:hypothetical protein